VNGEALARLWKDPDDLRDWPDDEHPAGQMYLHQSALVGGYGLFDVEEPDPMPLPTFGEPLPSFPFSRVSRH
jgi:hypothetical protein